MQTSNNAIDLARLLLCDMLCENSWTVALYLPVSNQDSFVNQEADRINGESD